jgi:hypothetical protein
MATGTGVYKSVVEGVYLVGAERVASLRWADERQACFAWSRVESVANTAAVVSLAALNVKTEGQKLWASCN